MKNIRRLPANSCWKAKSNSSSLSDFTIFDYAFFQKISFLTIKCCINLQSTTSFCGIDKQLYSIATIARGNKKKEFLSPLYHGEQFNLPRRIFSQRPPPGPIFWCRIKKQARGFHQRYNPQTIQGSLSQFVPVLYQPCR